MKTLVLTFTILLAITASAQEPATQSSIGTEQTVFTKAPRAGEDKWRSFFMFPVSGHEYTIRADGRAESATGKVRAHNFSLKVDRGHIEQVYYFEHDGDLLLLYELSDELNGWGYIIRLNQTTVKPKWVAGVSGFNFGPTLVEANFAYLTAVDLIAKLDLQSGAYVWRHENLQEKYSPSFQAFREPWIKGDHVFFKEDLAPFRPIEVDKATGKIINILK